MKQGERCLYFSSPNTPTPHRPRSWGGGLCSFLPDEAESKEDVEDWKFFFFLYNLRLLAH